MHGPTPSARAGQLGRGGKVWAQASAREGSVAAHEAGRGRGEEKGGLMSTQPAPEPRSSQEVSGTQAITL